MPDGLTEQELFSMAFNAGMACLAQIMQKYDGIELQAIIAASHKISTDNLAKLLEMPEEDVSLFFQPYIQPVQEMIDKVAQ